MKLAPTALPQTADDVLVEGNPAAPVSPAAVDALRTGHQFLIDIAHNASPFNGQTGAAAGRQRTTSSAAMPAAAAPTTTSCSTRTTWPATAASTRTSASPPCTTMFHSEHNRLVDHTKQVVLAIERPRLPQRMAARPTSVRSRQRQRDRRPAVGRRAPVPGGEVRHRDAVPASGVRGVRAHDPAAGRRVPRARPGTIRTIDPSIVAEFAHVGLSLRPLDADRDDRPLRPQLRRRARSA